MFDVGESVALVLALGASVDARAYIALWNFPLRLQDYPDGFAEELEV